MDKYNGTWYADREKSIDQCQSSWLPHVIKLHLIRHEILSDIIIVFRIEQIISLSIFDLNNTKQTEILMEAKPFLWCANLCTRTDRLGLISLVPHIIKLNLITSVILVIGTYYDHSLYSVDQIMSLSFSGSNTQSEQKQSKSPSPSPAVKLSTLKLQSQSSYFNPCTCWSHMMFPWLAALYPLRKLLPKWKSPSPWTVIFFMHVSIVHLFHCLRFCVDNTATFGANSSQTFILLPWNSHGEREKSCIMIVLKQQRPLLFGQRQRSKRAENMTEG